MAPPLLFGSAILIRGFRVDLGRQAARQLTRVAGQKLVKARSAFLAYVALGARRSVREAARQHHVSATAAGEIKGVEDTTVRTWISWSSRHKWVSRANAREAWLTRVSDEQIVANLKACHLALTTRAHGFLTANDAADFLRAARALSVHVPPIRRVADVSERIEDLSDVPDAPRDERRTIRDAARQKNEETPVTPWRDHSPACCGGAVVLRCGTRSPASGNSSRSEARVMP